MINLLGDPRTLSWLQETPRELPPSLPKTLLFFPLSAHCLSTMLSFLSATEKPLSHTFPESPFFSLPSKLSKLPLKISLTAYSESSCQPPSASHHPLLQLAIITEKYAPLF